MHDDDTAAFSKAIVERALADYARAEGDLGPTDPLDVAGIKAVAAELDVPDAYVDAALANPVVYPPTAANGFIVRADRFMAATPEQVLLSARPVLLHQHRMQVLATGDDGAAFEPIDPPGSYSRNYGLAAIEDLSLGCATLGRRTLGHQSHSSHPGSSRSGEEVGTVVHLRGRVSHPAGAIFAGAIGMALGFGALPGLLLYTFNIVDAILGGRIAFSGIVLAACFGAWLAWRFWRRDVDRLTLTMTGALNQIADDLPTHQPTPSNTEQIAVVDHVADQMGGFVGRLVRSFSRARRGEAR